MKYIRGDLIKYNINEDFKSKRRKHKPIQYVINKNNCWECISHTPVKNGYLRVKRHGILYYMHRYIYELFNEEIKNDLHVLHKCDNVKCINPKHLYLGTHSQNMKDKKERNRARGINKGKGGNKGNNKKLSEEQLISIKKLLLKGVKGKDIAEEYKISIGLISEIKNGKSIYNKFLNGGLKDWK